MTTDSNFATTMSFSHGPILVVAAHPDDEILGCGGTMARLAAHGAAVRVLILGEGMTSRIRPGQVPGDLDLASLHSNSRAANACLGVCDIHQADFPDNRFDTVPLLDIVKRIEAAIEDLRPVLVFTQHGGDLNVDHERTYRAALAATRPMAGNCIAGVLGYEVASSTEWSFQHFAPSFRPNLFVDIGDTLERKIQAMECYESERRLFPHPRSPEALRAAGQRWGSVCGYRAAEAFQWVWSRL